MLDRDQFIRRCIEVVLSGMTIAGVVCNFGLRDGVYAPDLWRTAIFGLNNSCFSQQELFYCGVYQS